MEKVKRAWPYLLVMILGFYLLPLVIRDTGTAMLILLAVIPLICFVCACIYGMKNLFSPYYALAVTVLFLPSVFIFYNVSAWVYAVGYGVVAVLGNLVGAMFYRRV